MRLAAAVMAHPTRRPLVADLLRRLDRDVPVHYDPNPEPSHDPQRVWETCAGAWRLIDQAADYGMVLQDDITVCRDLIAGAEEALNVLPAGSVASLYLAGHRYIRTTGVDDLPDGSWLRRPRLQSGQAIVLPTKAINDMLAWCAPHTSRLDDNRISLYFQTLGRPAYFSAPSLVDHRPVASLIGHPDGRVAHRFIGEHRSALDLRWSSDKHRGARHGAIPQIAGPH